MSVFSYVRLFSFCPQAVMRRNVSVFLKYEFSLGDISDLVTETLIPREKIVTVWHMRFSCGEDILCVGAM